MKKTTLAVTLGAALALSTIFIARAEDPVGKPDTVEKTDKKTKEAKGEKPEKKEKKEKPKKEDNNELKSQFATADVDGDGFLSDEEFKTVIGRKKSNDIPRMEKMFVTADLDGDDKLSEQELETFRIATKKNKKGNK